MAASTLVPTAVAAQRLNVCTETIRRWLVSGQLTGQRIGKVWAADEASVEAKRTGNPESRDRT